VATLESDLAQEKEHLIQELSRRPPALVPGGRGLTGSPRRAAGNSIASVETKRLVDTARFLQDWSGCVLLETYVEHVDAGDNHPAGDAAVFKFIFSVNERDTLPFRITLLPVAGSGQSECLWQPILDGSPPLRPEFIDSLDWLSLTFSFPLKTASHLSLYLLKIKYGESISKDDQEQDPEEGDEPNEEPTVIED